MMGSILDLSIQLYSQRRISRVYCVLTSMGIRVAVLVYLWLPQTEWSAAPIRSREKVDRGFAATTIRLHILKLRPCVVLRTAVTSFAHGRHCSANLNITPGLVV